MKLKVTFEITYNYSEKDLYQLFDKPDMDLDDLCRMERKFFQESFPHDIQEFFTEQELRSLNVEVVPL